MSQEQPPGERGTNDRKMSNLWGLWESANEELKNTRDKEKRKSIIHRAHMLMEVIKAHLK